MIEYKKDIPENTLLTCSKNIIQIHIIFLRFKTSKSIFLDVMLATAKNIDFLRRYKRQKA